MAQKEKTKPIIDELAASGDGIASQLGGFISEIALPDDPLLKAMGWNMDKYVQVLRDEQVRTTLAQRRAAVVQAEWDVIPGGAAALDKKAAESLKEQLSNVGIDSATRKMLYGLFYGYSVAECMWSVDGREVILDEIKVRKARRFRFGKDGKVGLEDRLGDYTPPAEQSGSSDNSNSNPVVVAEEEEAKKEKLLSALRDAYKVDPTKPPSVSSLKQALGFKVSGDEKDAAWAQVVDENKDGKSE